MDPNGARALRSLLKDLCRRDGVTILYTTHYLFEAEELSDRLAIIDRGRKVLEGSPDAVRAGLGDNRIIEVQLAAGEDGALAALRACALVEDVILERRQPTVTTVRLRTREPLGSVTDLAGIDGLAGGRVLSVALVRPTLEDVFVTLTGAPIVQTQEGGTDDAS